MQIRKIMDKPDTQNIVKRKPLSPEEIQREFDYYRAEKLMRQMLKKGLVSETEFNKIMLLNRESFSPMLAKIMPDNP